MYMEAFGSVGNWADSVVKKALTEGIYRKIAKEDVKGALPKQGVSPNSEGGSNQTTPQANEVQPQANDISEELMAKDKAIKSLNSKVANWRAKAEYRNSLIKMQEKKLNKYRKKEMVGVK